MPEFLELLPPDQARSRLLENLPKAGKYETIPTSDSLNRILALAVNAPHPLPSFSRSTVDGFAVRAADTYGASDSLPAYLTEIGEVPMGAAAGFSLDPAQCALIHTGGMLPAGADGVVMVEHTQAARPGEIEVLRAVAVGENVLRVGEDVTQGQEILPAGVRIRPAEIGGLMALGITEVQVFIRPRIGILSTGDEVISPVQPLGPGQVRDINAYTLSALIEKSGGIPARYGIIPDRLEALEQAAFRALEECDGVVITAGSSASTRDLTAQVINSLGDPGVLVHGVNVRPGKPTILGVCGSKPVIGLPGNPVSALVIAALFILPAVEAMQGLSHPAKRPFIPARLTINLASQAGREDWVPVRLLTVAGVLQAEPIFGKSNLIFTLARADGLVRIPPDATGLSTGAEVAVYLLP